MITIAQPYIGEEEIDAVVDVMRTGMIAQGKKTEELESAFAKYCGTKYAIAVNSGTAAIHAALFAAGVREGDEVITTPFSFIATINPILMLGAKPVLVDIDPHTFNIDTSKVAAAVTERTKAIVPVHLYGQPVNCDQIQAIADEHNLLIVEDACQAIGATFRGRKAGSLGDLGCFSLYATKNIMSGEGGVVTTDNEGFMKAIKAFRQHGMVSPYEYTELGYNYRMTDLQAAIAVEQLKRVDEFNDKRRANAAKLANELSGLNQITLPWVAPEVEHVYHQYTIVLDSTMDRAKITEDLRSRDVGAGIYYPKPLHAYPHIQELGYKIGDFPIAEDIASRVVSLPIHPAVTSDDIVTIAAALKEAINVERKG